ncbi:MAG: UDP-N-acetylmuramate dehydrogenase [Thiotrichaceae bacterium]|nr:UDP-N-acetylmuramate dehydrogenase [Thiotrichaceae bacterium]
MTISENISLQPYNSFGIDIDAQYFMELNRLDDVVALREWRVNHDLPYLLLGGGSNCLFTQTFEGLIVRVNLQGKALVSEDDTTYYVKASAGENWHQFVRWTIEQGWGGLENLSLIPGTVGAAPVQNIGAYGVELVDRLHSVDVIDLDRGEASTLDKAACQFSYRESYFKSVSQGRLLITAVTFALPKKPRWKIAYAGVQQALEGKELTARNISDTIIALRQSKLPDPTIMGNAGSFFKNPIISNNEWQNLVAKYSNLPNYPQADGSVKTSAAWLIDQCGWKGHRQGNVGVYKDHALVLVNHGGASGQAVKTLAEDIIRSVKDKFSLVLEAEPRVF